MAKNKRSIDNNRYIITSVNPQSPISEQYRTIRTTIDFKMADQGIKSFLVTSSEAAAGKSTASANLTVITSGPIPPNPSELLASSAMKNLIDSVSDFFDVVLIDTPPLSAVTDAQILGSYVGGAVIVVRAYETKKESLAKTKKMLEQVNANILGVILHGVDSSESPSYYYYGVE